MRPEPLFALLLFFGIAFSMLGCDSQETDDTAPTVEITNPQDGATLREPTTIRVDADDNSSVAKVTFYADGAMIHTDESEPYEYTWDASDLVDDSGHTLRVEATDGSGNEAEAQIEVILATPEIPVRVVPPPSRTGEDFQIELEIDGEVYIDRVSVSSSSGIDDEIPLDEEYSELDEITLPSANDYYENCSRCEITVVIYGETRSGFQVDFEERRTFNRY